MRGTVDLGAVGGGKEYGSRHDIMVRVFGNARLIIVNRTENNERNARVSPCIYGGYIDSVAGC